MHILSPSIVFLHYKLFFTHEIERIVWDDILLWKEIVRIVTKHPPSNVDVYEKIVIWSGPTKEVVVHLHTDTEVFTALLQDNIKLHVYTDVLNHKVDLS